MEKKDTPPSRARRLALASAAAAGIVALAATVSHVSHGPHGSRAAFPSTGASSATLGESPAGPTPEAGNGNNYGRGGIDRSLKDLFGRRHLFEGRKRKRPHVSGAKPPNNGDEVIGGGEGTTLRDAGGLLVEVGRPSTVVPPQAVMNRQSGQATASGSSSDPSSGSSSSDDAAETADFAASSSARSSSAQSKVINGVSIARSSHPYIVRLHWTYPGDDADEASGRSFFCDGSLITPDVVLTAAHCIGHDVYVDIFDLGEAVPKTYRITDREIHPLYENKYFNSDFALIKISHAHVKVKINFSPTGQQYWRLAGDFDLENPPIIRLHRYGSAGGDISCESLTDRESSAVTTLKVLGYGRTSYPSGSTSYDDLQIADVHYIRNTDCDTMYQKAPSGSLPSSEDGEIITEDMLCAADTKEKQDACSGDSGGPLVAELPIQSKNGKLLTQVGIVSWGLGCALSSYPGVYSRVAEEITWIEDIVCGDGNFGMSPKSCVYDANTGERHIRDFAMEQLQTSGSRKLREDLNPRNVTRSIRDWVGKESPGSSPGEKPLRGKTPEENSRLSLGGLTKSVELEQACELLGGVEHVLLQKLTRQPTNHPTQKPTTPQLASSANTCSKNLFDVSYFLADRNRVRNCRWVRRKCHSRCQSFRNCCPQTCSYSRCR